MLNPDFRSPILTESIARIEALYQRLSSLSVAPATLISLRELARNTMIFSTLNPHGTRFTREHMIIALEKEEDCALPEKEGTAIRSYNVALKYIEKIGSTATSPLNEEHIQKLHGLLIGKTGKQKSSAYRDNQDPVRDTKTYAIIHTPPQAQDIPVLIRELLAWVAEALEKKIACPLIAGIAHYEITTIRPYLNGNGRLARLLARLVLYRGNYDLKGTYALEQHYAENTKAYQENLLPKKSYLAYTRPVDYTPWLIYFYSNLELSLEQLHQKLLNHEKRPILAARTIDAWQCKALDLFKSKNAITALEIQELLHLKTHNARALCLKWEEEGFFEFDQPSKKKRAYKLGSFLVSL